MCNHHKLGTFGAMNLINGLDYIVDPQYIHRLCTLPLDSMSGISYQSHTLYWYGLLQSVFARQIIRNSRLHKSVHTQLGTSYMYYPLRMRTELVLSFTSESESESGSESSLFHLPVRVLRWTGLLLLRSPSTSYMVKGRSVRNHSILYISRHGKVFPIMKYSWANEILFV